jgi:hypothetical protein
MRIDHEVALTQAMPIKAYDYWRARRGSRIMPTRQDINPRDMREFVASAGLIEARPMADGYEYLVRLAGTRIEEIMGPISGKLFSEFLPPEIEARWRLVCDEVRRSRGPVSISGRMAFQARHWLKTETFVGPLGEEGQEITMFLLGSASWTQLSDEETTVPA